MQCSRGSGSYQFHSGLADGLNDISKRNLQDAQTKLLQEQTKALQQQNTQQAQPAQAQQGQLASNPQLKIALEQIAAEMKEACARAEYNPLFVHTACDPNDLTLEQRTDKSTIARLRNRSIRDFAPKAMRSL